MVRALLVVGTRPEVIKLAPVARALQKPPTRFHASLLAVRQQDQILDHALAEWDLVPEAAIDPGTRGKPLGATLAAALGAIAEELAARPPDVVVVQGDTTTALAAALAAFYAQIPVAHVEAGLRTFDPRQPFPEEAHRAMIDRLATVHYAPTERARKNLLAEGVPEDRVLVVGNTGVDALFAARAGRAALPGARRGERRTVVVTGHRRESFGEGTAAVCEALVSLVRRRADVEVVYVLHPHPSARAPACAILAGQERIRLLEPMRYRDFVALLERAHLVLTDSGGVQEEAPYLGIPVLVTRAVTEREELVELGRAEVVGLEPRRIFEAVVELLDDEARYQQMARPAAPYGDGQAALRIRADLERRLTREG